MSKEDLLGESSVIVKAELVITKAENTEVPVDLSSLSEDEGIYTYMDKIGDFAVLEISPGKKIKVEKLNETQYNIYEDYVNSSSPVTKVMNEGETSTYNGFGYQIGSFSGPTDPQLLPTPICFPAGTQVTTDQGDINIEMLIKDVNTIDGKRIVDITETAPIFKYLICFEKDSLGNNIPSMKTEMSPDHCVLYKSMLMKASEVAKICENVYNAILKICLRVWSKLLCFASILIVIYTYSYYFENGIAKAPTELHGYQQNYMGTKRITWAPMKLHRYQWNGIGTNRIAWVPIELHGYQ